MKKTKIVIGAAHLLLAILLIFLTAFLFAGLSTGWFSNNKEVKATGMSVKAEGVHLDQIVITGLKIERPRNSNPSEKKTIVSLSNPNGNLDWSQANELLPGDEVTVTARFKTLAYSSDANKKIPVEFWIRTPQENGDTPVTIGKNKYFLSTQMRVVSAAYRIQGGQDTVIMDESGIANQAEMQWLATHKLAWENTEAITGTGDIPLGRKPSTNALNGTYALDPGKTYEVVLKLEFFNDNGSDQAANGGQHNQSPIRGNPADNPVTPSSFHRELVIYEII